MVAATNSDRVGPDEGNVPLLTHREFLGPRLYLHTRVRLAVAVLILVGAFVARHLVGVTGLDVTALVVLALAVIAYNSVAFALTRTHRQPDSTAEGYRRLLLPLYGAVVLDYLALTVAIWLVGGARSPFLALYLLHVTVSCVSLSRRAAVTLTLFAYGLLVVLVIGEWSGTIPPHLPEGAVASTAGIDGRYVLTVLTAYAVLFGLVAFLLLGVTRLLRHGERRIRLANAELKRLSETRRDFLHIAVHNLQAPVGAVTMFLTNLRDGLGGPLTDKQDEWLSRSLARLEEMSRFTVNMRILAKVESGMIEAAAVPVDVAGILVELVEENRDLAEAKQQTLTVQVPKALPEVLGFRALLKEAIVNYVTNAIKYTPAGGNIVVRGVADRPVVRIEVEDDGEGISAEDQERLFEEFVRLSRGDGKKGGAGGSGLGLSIVKRVVEGHGGTVGVRSEPGKGSTFTIELPA